MYLRFHAMSSPFRAIEKRRSLAMLAVPLKSETAADRQLGKA
jgi:hypothetical protein